MKLPNQHKFFSNFIIYICLLIVGFSGCVSPSDSLKSFETPTGVIFSANDILESTNAKPFQLITMVEMEETTIPPINTTLDTTNDNNGTTTGWKISPTNVKKWFEYYDNTDQLRGNSTDITRCASIISGVSSQLGNVDGIWAACQDTSLTSECTIIPNYPCHPKIANSNINRSPFRTAKMKLFLQGFAIVRISLGSSLCFDYSLRKDPLSHCHHVRTWFPSRAEWTHVTTSFGSTDWYLPFYEFDIQLIARFKDDVALLDKVEATDLHLCGGVENEYLCMPTTTPRPRPTGNTQPSTPETVLTTSLETKNDTETETNWEIPSLTPKWLEYYADSEALRDEASDTNSCAKIVAEAAISLTNVEGIWSSCQVPDQASECLQDANDPCYPFIHYSPSREVLVSVTLRFYLEGLATLRLHVENECIDYTVSEDVDSPCKFIPIHQNETFWRGSYWMAAHGQVITDFSVSLISRTVEDAVLLDRIKVEYLTCHDEDCSQYTTTTTTVDPTTDLPTSPDSEEETDKTTISTTTEGTVPSETTEGDVPSETTEQSGTSSSTLETSSESTEITVTDTTSQRTTPENPTSGSFSLTPMIMLLVSLSLLSMLIHTLPT